MYGKFLELILFNFHKQNFRSLEAFSFKPHADSLIFLNEFLNVSRTFGQPCILHVKVRQSYKETYKNISQ